MLKFWATWLPLVLFSVILAGCEPTVVDAPLAVEGADGAAENSSDQTAAESLAKQEEIAEAKDWLSPKHTNHALFKGDREQIIQMVDDLYAAGAPKIYVVGIHKEAQGEIAVELIAEMPKEASTRKKVIASHNKFWKKYLSEEDPEEVKDYLEQDRGQKYLVLNFDL